MELLIGYFEIFPLEMGGKMGRSLHAMGGGCSKHRCVYDGRKGVKFFAILICTY